MSNQPTTGSSTAPPSPPYFHQPRPRRRRRLAPTLIACSLCFFGIASSAQAAATAPSVSAVQPTWESALGQEWAMPGLSVEEERIWRLQPRSESSKHLVEDAASVSSSMASAATGQKTTVADTQTVIYAPSSSATPGASSSERSTTTVSDASASGSASTTATSTSTAPSSTSTAVPAGYQLPQAFDTTLGTNFTSTACPSFFETFLADPTFISCAPFSLLLATSSAFFTAERSPYSLLTYVLNASCSAPETTCNALMDSLAQQIRLDNTCAADLALQNPLATEALQGFRNYRLYREAGCQTNNQTGAYCFADASAQSDPSELYFYYLPEGTNLPSGTTTDCNGCMGGLFSIYARYATNSTLAISQTYSSGRAVAALACGPTFAPLIAAVTSSSPLSLSTPLHGFMLALVALVVALWV
ncbi:hypothetical protein JCM1840_005129 [Sporobolomyces johnsonii]